MRVLSALKNNQVYNGEHPKSLNRISMNLNMSYNTVFKIAKMLKEKELINCVKQGRVNKITFTDKGEKLVNNINKVLEVVNNGHNKHLE